ncbi:sugar isomerase domain-containing protein [Cohnella sp. GCM10012308]|uniref:sugar isomerase domain-containing protein n=1 Tax=Cohnella sp. GCM10012308 TaxID=3317329 RepID=UPI0036171CEB
MSTSPTERYLALVTAHLNKLQEEEHAAVLLAARLVAEQVKADRIVYAYGPGGHSNLGAQEIFFRAGGLMHVSAILDEGTLLSGGALRSMAIERTSGYAAVVLEDYGIGEGDLLILINAYGINAAVIDAAMEAKRRGASVIAVTSSAHARETPPDHPARHPSKRNLHELADVVLDCKIGVGDAVLELDGLEQKVGAMSTFANAFLLNALVAETVAMLSAEGVRPPIWMSGNATGGDAWNRRHMAQIKGRVKKL